jgi:hypothetical protein
MDVLANSGALQTLVGRVFIVVAIVVVGIANVDGTGRGRRQASST